MTRSSTRRGGFAAVRRLYARLDSWHLVKPAHVLEQAVKIPMFGCRDCGDCSLPDIAYQCPESACAKNQRNGPCGGSLAGECEVPGRPCVWANAYDRLKPYGAALSMLDRRASHEDNALRGTTPGPTPSLGRDHYRHGEGIVTAAGGWPFIIIGENIHTSRVVRRDGARSGVAPDGRPAVRFPDGSGGDRTGHIQGPGLLSRRGSQAWCAYQEHDGRPVAKR
jgi:hypothetical protein